jgi:pentatricopeptide repeat protein
MEKENKNKHDKKIIFVTIIDKIPEIYTDKERSKATRAIAHNIAKSKILDKLSLIHYLIETVKIINDDFYRTDVIKDISIEINNIQSGDMYKIFNEIIEYANSIYTDEDRSESLISIAKQIATNNTQGKDLLIDKIITYTKKIRNDRVKAVTIGVIATEISKIEEKEQAYKIPLLEKMTDIIRAVAHPHKPKAFGKIVKAMVKNGIDNTKIFDKIINSAKNIVSSKIKTEVLIRIIEELSKLEQDTYATFDKQLVLLKIIDSAKEIYSDKSKAELYSYIVDELSRIESEGEITSTFLFDKVIRYASTIKNAYHKGNTFEHIVKSLAKKGQFDKAISLFDYIEDDENRMFALESISEELSRLG